MTDRIRVFDVETTGTDPKEDRVVEIAAYDVERYGLDIAPVATYLVDPGRRIPPAASAVHHITDADIEKAQAPLFGEVWPRLHDSEVKFFAAHNCEFEQGFMPSPAGVEWICTYKCALRAWPDAPGHSNQVLRYWLDLDKEIYFIRANATPAHRAGPDAYVTAFLLATLLSEGERTVADLVAWSKEPKLYTTLTFGKHRGLKLTEAPFDYLQWLRDGRHDMEADWRHCAKVELERRKKAASA
jgi:exodeoxyribonuclease X